jgi:hypothetical protein
MPAGRAIADLGEGTPAALPGAELCVDVAAAARSCCAAEWYSLR